MTILAEMSEASVQLILSAVIVVALAGAVITFVLAAFSQQGSVEISPQRQTALETGHSDRRTVFEIQPLRPIVWIALTMAHRLAMPRGKAWLRRTLVASGNPDLYTPEEYLALSFLTGFALAAAIEALYFLASRGDITLLWPVAGFTFGVVLTLAQLRSRASKRVRTIARRVPYALDLISLAMGSGATFTEALEVVIRRGGSDEDEPLNGELEAVMSEIQLGATRRTALQNLAQRVPLEMLRIIVASVVQAEQLGTPLADVLKSQATLLRLQRSVQAEEAAAKASVRILLPGLLIMMSVVLAVFAPAILRIFRDGLM